MEPLLPLSWRLLNPDASPYERASMIIVPADTPGFHLVRNISIMGEAGGGYLSHAEIEYDNCRVPLTNIIGKAGSGISTGPGTAWPGKDSSLHALDRYM